MQGREERTSLRTLGEEEERASPSRRSCAQARRTQVAKVVSKAVRRRKKARAAEGSEEKAERRKRGPAGATASSSVSDRRVALPTIPRRAMLARHQRSGREERAGRSCSSRRFPAGGKISERAKEGRKREGGYVRTRRTPSVCHARVYSGEKNRGRSSIVCGRLKEEEKKVVKAREK